MGFICTALKGSLELALGVIIWLAGHYWLGRETWTKILDITTNRLTAIFMLSGTEDCYLDFLKLCVCVWICTATCLFWIVCITVNKHSLIGIADIWQYQNFFHSFCCWGQDVPGENGQYHVCWCPDSLYREAINTYASGTLHSYSNLFKTSLCKPFLFSENQLLTICGCVVL